MWVSVEGEAGNARIQGSLCSCNYPLKFTGDFWIILISLVGCDFKSNYGKLETSV